MPSQAASRVIFVEKFNYYVFLSPFEFHLNVVIVITRDGMEPVLKQFWSSSEPDLKKFWTSSEPVLKKSWTSFEPDLEKFITRSREVLNQFWTRSKEVQNQFLRSSEPVQLFTPHIFLPYTALLWGACYPCRNWTHDLAAARTTLSPTVLYITVEYLSLWLQSDPSWSQRCGREAGRCRWHHQRPHLRWPA